MAARREAIRDLDIVYLHKDGRRRQVRSNGVPILDAEGNLLGYRGLGRDVTEKRLAWEAMNKPSQAVE